MFDPTPCSLCGAADDGGKSVRVVEGRYVFEFLCRHHWDQRLRDGLLGWDAPGSGGYPIALDEPGSSDPTFVRENYPPWAGAIAPESYSPVCLLCDRSSRPRTAQPTTTSFGGPHRQRLEAEHALADHVASVHA